MLHRDIKPSNLLLDVDGHVWVTDFGLAKLEGSDGPTRPGDIIGTLRYMAPERFDGWSDRRSDIYGLGMTLYELLTLRPAFEAGDAAEADRASDRHDPPPAPRKVDPTDAARPRNNRAEGHRQGAGRAVCDGRGPGVGPGKLPGGQADRGAAQQRQRSGPGGGAGGTRRRRACWRPAPSRLWRSWGSASDSSITRVSIAHTSGKSRPAKARPRLRYFENMVLAEREWSDSNVGRAEQLLDECIPKPGSKDLRGWEWHYLKRQCHTDLNTIPGPPSQAMGIAFSPDDRHLATTGYDDKAVRVWNVQTGELEKTLLGLTPTGIMSEGLAYSPDGKLLAASSGHFSTPGEVIIWDVATESNRSISSPNVCGESSNVAFSPDGNRLAAVSGEWDKSPTLTIWDMRTGRDSVTITGETKVRWAGSAWPSARMVTRSPRPAENWIRIRPTINPATVKIWNS